MWKERWERGEGREMGEEGEVGEGEGEGGREGNESGRKKRQRGGEGKMYLDPPAKEVAWHKHIHLVHYDCKGAIRVARSIDAAVLSISTFW